MNRQIFEQPHHLDVRPEHLLLPKSPPRWLEIGLCKAVLPPSALSKI